MTFISDAMGFFRGHRPCENQGEMTRRGRTTQVPHQGFPAVPGAWCTDIHTVAYGQHHVKANTRVLQPVESLY